MTTDPTPTRPDIDEIKNALEDVTPGPWSTSCRDASGHGSGGLGWEIDGPPEPMLRGQFERGADARFIAAAREWVPALVAEVERLRAGVSEEEVEAAAQALNDTGIGYTFGSATPWERLDEDVRRWYRDCARKILEAAVSVRAGSTENQETKSDANDNHR